jgi:hypothetical protein
MVRDVVLGTQMENTHTHSIATIPSSLSYLVDVRPTRRRVWLGTFRDAFEREGTSTSVLADRAEHGRRRAERTATCATPSAQRAAAASVQSGRRVARERTGRAQGGHVATGTTQHRQQTIHDLQGQREVDARRRSKQKKKKKRQNRVSATERASAQRRSKTAERSTHTEEQ